MLKELEEELEEKWAALEGVAAFYSLLEVS